MRYGEGQNSRLLFYGEMSPRELGDQLTARALEWVARWGWAAPSTIDYMCLDGRRKGKAAALQRRGLLSATTPGTYSPDAPRKILTLTERGKEELVRIKPYIDSELLGDIPVRWNQLRHDYIVQNLVAYLYSEDMSYQTGAELAMKYKIPKVPDAIVNSDIVNLGNTAIELDLSIKKERELHQAVRGLVQMIKEGYYIWIISPSRPILERYKKLLRKGAIVYTYARLPNRLWERNGHFAVDVDIKPKTVKYSILKSTIPNFAEKKNWIYPIENV